jgi:hypothetical protein
MNVSLHQTMDVDFWGSVLDENRCKSDSLGVGANNVGLSEVDDAENGQI